MIKRKEKEKLLGQRALVIWFTGLSGAGKTTLADALERELFTRGFATQMLDGDIVRDGINSNLKFTREDRLENIRRIAEVSKLLINSGIITINSFISPTNEIRQMAKDIIGKDDFLEIFIDTPLEVCEERDVKGLYKKARSGQIPNFTGITAPFDIPENPALRVPTVGNTVDESMEFILNFILPKIKNIVQ